jgi:hypothetical protein
MRLLLILGLWTAAVWLVAVKTERGTQWDQSEQIRRQAQRATAAYEALARCEAGEQRDSLGFWPR